MKYSTLLAMMALLLFGACKTQSNLSDTESASDLLRSSHLVGTWRWLSPPGMDPPMELTYTFESNGDFSMLLRLRKDGDYIPPTDLMEHGKGHWHLSRLDLELDVLHIRVLSPEEIDEAAQEVSIVDDTMILKPLPKDRHESWMPDEGFVMKRTKQE